MINKSRYVYIASPFTKGNTATNLRISIDLADKLLMTGYIPFVPLLSHFWDIVYSHEPNVWYNFDLKWLERCDCIIRLPGESKGADLEEEHARKLNMPIFYSYEAFVRYAGNAL